MNTLHLVNGDLYQWDKGRRIRLVLDTPEDLTRAQIHFSAVNTERALIVEPIAEDDGIFASIPNVLLQTAGEITAYLVLSDASVINGDSETDDSITGGDNNSSADNSGTDTSVTVGGQTILWRSFRVIGRKKPDDYVYTESTPPVPDADTLKQLIRQQLDEALASVTPAPVTYTRRLVFEDHFDREKLNTDIWSYALGSKGAELQYYTDNEKNVFLRDSCLVLRAIREEAPNGYQWTSGQIETRSGFQFTRGYVEARIKLPNCAGTLPAFWMLGCSNWKDYLSKGALWEMLGETWPGCGEIDIMEQMWRSTDDPYKNPTWMGGTLHCADENGIDVDVGLGLHKVPDASEWHTYAIEWTENTLTTYYDGQPNGSGTIDLSQMEKFAYIKTALAKPYYLILNLAVTGANSGFYLDPPDDVSQMDMLVDYVRIYSLETEEEHLPLRASHFALDHTEVELNLIKDEFFPLRSVFYPDHGVYDRTVTWESSDPAIVTCYGGTLRPKGVGSAQITATMRDGLRASCRVNVNSGITDTTLALYNLKSMTDGKVLDLVAGENLTLSGSCTASSDGLVIAGYDSGAQLPIASFLAAGKPFRVHFVMTDMSVDSSEHSGNYRRLFAIPGCGDVYTTDDSNLVFDQNGSRTDMLYRLGFVVKDKLYKIDIDIYPSKKINLFVSMFHPTTKQLIDYANFIDGTWEYGSTREREIAAFPTAISASDTQNMISLSNSDAMNRGMNSTITELWVEKLPDTGTDEPDTPTDPDTPVEPEPELPSDAADKLAYYDLTKTSDDTGSVVDLINGDALTLIESCTPGDNGLVVTGSQSGVRMPLARFMNDGTSFRVHMKLSDLSMDSSVTTLAFRRLFSIPGCGDVYNSDDSNLIFDRDGARTELIYRKGYILNSRTYALDIDIYPSIRVDLHIKMYDTPTGELLNSAECVNGVWSFGDTIEHAVTAYPAVLSALDELIIANNNAMTRGLNCTIRELWIEELEPLPPVDPTESKLAFYDLTQLSSEGAVTDSISGDVLTLTDDCTPNADGLAIAGSQSGVRMPLARFFEAGLPFRIHMKLTGLSMDSSVTSVAYRRLFSLPGCGDVYNSDDSNLIFDLNGARTEMLYRSGYILKDKAYSVDIDIYPSERTDLFITMLDAANDAQLNTAACADGTWSFGDTRTHTIAAYPAALSAADNLIIANNDAMTRGLNCTICELWVESIA